MLEFGARKIGQLRERRLLLFLLTRASRMASKAKGITSLSEQVVTAFAHVIVVFSAHRIPTFTPNLSWAVRLYRQSMRYNGRWEKWDRRLGQYTYGQVTLYQAYVKRY